MKKMMKKDKRSELEKEIDRRLKELEKMDLESEEYKKAVLNLKILYEAKSLDKKDILSKNQAIGVASNLIGIGMILKHEELNVITSKALGLVNKIKL